LGGPDGRGGTGDLGPPVVTVLEPGVAGGVLTEQMGVGDDNNVLQLGDRQRQFHLEDLVPVVDLQPGAALTVVLDRPQQRLGLVAADASVEDDGPQLVAVETVLLEDAVLGAFDPALESGAAPVGFESVELAASLRECDVVVAGLP